MKMVINKRLFIFFAVIFSIIFLTMNVSAVTQIHNCQELQNMENNLAENYVLTNDVDCSATNPPNGWDFNNFEGYEMGFRPVGTLSNPFTGTFDGQNHIISNLYINRPNESEVGLFGKTNGGEIKNIGINGGEIYGNNNVGGLIGFASNSFIRDAYFSGDVEGKNIATGNLIGLSDFSQISDSYSEGSVIGGDDVGGLVGYFGYGGSITNSYSKADIMATDWNTFLGNGFGGLVGYNGGTITISYSISNIDSIGTNIGGFVGINHGTITKSYSAGDISSSGDNLGGFVGINSAGSITNSYSESNILDGNNYLGGFVGDNEASITNSYSVGTVSGSGSNIWAFSGQKSNGAICQNNFYDYQVGLSQEPNNCANGKNTQQMKTQSTFTDAGWDFRYIWEISNNDYPKIKDICSPEPEVCDGLDNDCDGYTDEETNVCNKGGYCDGQQGCIYPEAYWASDLAGNNRITTERDLILNNNYSLVLKNAPSIPSGKAWEFEIYEKDLANADDEIRVGTSGIFGYTSGNKVIARWKITSQDVANADETFDGNPFKFYFKVSIVDHAPPSSPFTGNVISGNQIDQAPPSSGQGPADQGPVTEYTYSSGNLELKSSSQQGCFDNDNDGFNDVGCGGNDCDDQNASINPDATETCDSVDNNCNGQTDESCIDCSQYVLCSDYNSNLCASDPCAIAASSVQSSDQNADCINNVCECSYDTTTTNCSSSYSIMGDLGFPLGSCQKTEDTTDTCEGDNILTYSWTAEWVWSQENEDYKTENGAYYDPDGKAAECVDGEQTISCPNQVQLPLVSWFGITGTILFISLGYFLLKRKELKNGNKK